jgi:hypothetical protein
MYKPNPEPFSKIELFALKNLLKTLFFSSSGILIPESINFKMIS